MKKIISLVLCVAMVLTCLAGCGGAQAADAAPAAAPAASSDAGSSDAGSADAASAEDLPFVELTWYCCGQPQSNPDPVFEKINEYLKEKLNCSLKMITYDYGSYDEMLTVMATAGEEFDLAFTSNWLFDYDQGARKGYLLELDDLLEKYGQDYLAQVPEKFRNDAIVDGHTYGLVNYQIECKAYAMEAQKQYIDKYNFDVSQVKKLADWEPLFEQVQADDPTMYGYLPDPTSHQFWCTIDEGLTKEPVVDGFSPFWIMRDGSNEIINIYEDPEYVENLKVLHDWYEKGYIRKDAASLTDLNAEQRSQKYVCWIAGNAKPGNETEAEQLMGFPVKDVIMQPAMSNRGNSIATLTGISSTSKNPERAMMLLNLVFADPYLFNLLCFGVEGVNYEFAEDGSVTSLEEGGYNPCVDWAMGNQFNAYVRTGQDLDVWDQTKAMNDASEPSILGSFSYDKTQLKTENAMVDAVVEEYRMGFMSGSYDIDETMPVFLQALKDAGADAVKADIEKQYAEYLASNS